MSLYMKFNMKIQFVGLTVGQLCLSMKFNMKIQFAGLTVGQLACS